MNIAIHCDEFLTVERDYEFIKKSFRYYNHDLLETYYATMLLKRDDWAKAEAALFNVRRQDNPFVLHLRRQIVG